MSIEGVGIDTGTPGAQPVGSDGRPLPSKLRFTVEADKQDVAHMARGFSAMGHQNVADIICQTAGIPAVQARIYEKYPKLTGAVIGVGVVGVGYGVYRLVRYIRNRNAMPEVTASGKVLPMNPPRAARG